MRTQTLIETQGADLGVWDLHGMDEGVDYSYTTYPMWVSVLLLGGQDVEEAEELARALDLGQGSPSLGVQGV